MEKEYQKWNKKSVEIRFADLDMLGHVNNAKYLTYLESARISYFHDVIGDKIDWSTGGIILAKAELNFAMPVMLEDLEVTIFTSCTKIGDKSFGNVTTLEMSQLVPQDGLSLLTSQLSPKCIRDNNSIPARPPTQHRTNVLAYVQRKLRSNVPVL